MSKYLKNLITDDLKKRLNGVSELLLIDIAALEANDNNIGKWKAFNHIAATVGREHRT